MNLILNRNFELPADGWYQLAPLGEFPHAAAGIIQVIDAEACTRMVASFDFQKNSSENFPGLLIDFDHFSLDSSRHSEAAGWITALKFVSPICDHQHSSADNAPASSSSESFVPFVVKNSPSGTGLFAQIRWSDTGEAAVRGGRYRFLSPVWATADCEQLDSGRLRPVRLLNAAVTNDPNLKGILPLSNRSPAEPQNHNHVPSSSASSAPLRDKNICALQRSSADNSSPVSSSLSCNSCDSWSKNSPARTSADNPSVSSVSSVVQRDPSVPLVAKKSGPSFDFPPLAEPSTGNPRGCPPNQEKKMDPIINALLNKLNLPAGTAQETLLAAVDTLAAPDETAALTNRAESAEAELARLQTAQLESDADAFCEANAALIENRSEVRARFIENRTLTEAVFKNLKTPAFANAHIPARSDSHTPKPLHNRDSKHAATQNRDASASESRAVRIRNRAAEIMKTERVAYTDAFRRAEQELSN